MPLVELHQMVMPNVQFEMLLDDACHPTADRCRVAGPVMCYGIAGDRQASRLLISAD
jgi:hypothetical protein